MTRQLSRAQFLHHAAALGLFAAAAGSTLKATESPAAATPAAVTPSAGPLSSGSATYAA